MLSRAVFATALGGASRRTCVRALSSSSNWDSVGSALTPEIQRGYAQVRRNFDARQAAARQMSAPIEDIDWESFRSRVGDPAIVDQLKAEFEAEMAKVEDYVPPASVTEVSEKGWAQAILNAKIDSRVAEFRVAELEEKIAKLEANRVTLETTIDDIRELYAADFENEGAAQEAAAEDAEGVSPLDAARARALDELKSSGHDMSLLDWEAPDGGNALAAAEAEKAAKMARLQAELDAWKQKAM